MLSLTSVAFAQTKPAAGPDQALMDIEHAWAAAALKNDVAALGAILADNFWATSPEGKIIMRAQALADAKANKLTRSAVSDIKVVLINPTTAIVTGVWSGAGANAKGMKFDTSERWTDVFVNQGGKWKCVTSQSTTVAK
jgi:ketosteroid isomerase-like protein